MSTRTYQFKIRGTIINIKARKDQADRIARRLTRPFSLSQYYREITGVHGGESSETILQVLFTGHGLPVVDEQDYKESLQKLMELMTSFSPITEVNYAPLVTLADEIFHKHIPVKDSRRTQEEIAESNKLYQERLAEREHDSLAWVDEYCQSRDMVPITPGKMSVYLTMCYDNSDPMTDYYDPHHHWGKTMLLAVVHPARQTERLARQVLSRYPELESLDWSWHTENYSMGHGNYLQSSPQGDLPGDIKTYGGYGSPKWFYEVQFSTYTKEMYAYKGYPGNTANNTQTPGKASDSTEYSISYEGDWTWVRFLDKPADEILDALRGLGMRFSRRRQAWYATSVISEDKINFVLGVFIDAQSA